MIRFLLFSLLAFTGFAVPQVARAAEASPAADTAGSPRAFSLAAPDGSQHDVTPGQSELTVVCFLGTECPLARLYAGRLSALSEQFADRDVRFIGVNSNQQDSADDVASYAENYGLRFPIVKDPGNVVADAYDALRTPTVFVLDRALNVRYQGRIDDQFLPGIARPAVEREDLRLAIEELLDRQPVRVPHTEAVGCLIGRIKQPVTDSGVTYSNQVARVLQRNCVECHREGQIGPFALTDYDEVVGWADMMLEVIEDGRMPPWHATADHAEIANARFMSEEDKQTLRDWVAAGAPEGDSTELPPPVDFVTGWNLPREPDLVVEMGQRPFTVPADGTVEYQYFVVDPGFETDRWVTAAQVIPGNRSVVHHAIAFIRPPDGTRFRGLGWLAAYVPGQRTLPYAADRGRRIPAGSKLVFQMHYTPTGTEQSDVTKIGLLFGDDSEITHEVFTVVGIDQDFEIPPFAGAVSVAGHVPVVSPRWATAGGWPAHAPAGQIVPTRDRARRRATDTAGRAPVRLQLAALLPARRAAPAGPDRRTRVRNDVRQLGGQPVQSRPVAIRHLG